MVDLTPLPLLSSFLSSSAAGGAGNGTDGQPSNISSNMSSDSGTAANFKETLAGVQLLSDPALPVDYPSALPPASRDAAAMLSTGLTAEKSPSANIISHSLAAFQNDFQMRQGSRLIGQGYSVAADAQVSRLIPIHSANTSTSDDVIEDDVPKTDGAEEEAATVASSPLPSATDLPSDRTVLFPSTQVEKSFSSLVPAISKVGAPAGQLAGGRAQASESGEASAGNALTGIALTDGEIQTADARGMEGEIGNVADASGAGAAKRKKKGDDFSPLALKSSASTGTAAAALVPFATLPVANSSTRGIAGPIPPVAGSNSQSWAASFGEQPMDVVPKSKTTAPGNGTASDLAFAVRFRSDPSVQSNSGLESRGSGDSGSNLGGNASQKPLPQAQTANGLGTADLKLIAQTGLNATGLNPAGENLAGSNTPALIAPALQHASPAAGSTAADSPAAVDSSAVDDIRPASESTPPALRSVQMQITGQDNQRVDVKLIERPGALSMSVRAADGSLTRSLQEHLPELTTKLAEQQTLAEWWVPKTPSTAPAGEAGASGDMTKQGESRSQGQPGASGQDSGKQQGGRQGDQPTWVDELAAMNNSKTNRKEYIWHQ